ncbi:ABC transporter ATP-binding protein [Budvicia aquatica]|uniref:ABC transporter ATP-binding protein n=1 Tax=Budvicia aquatica TaxID=82979 RepID=A0A2C6DNS3_9GAMM|nr:ABC transporter ATP-binding protein [Budvicia aquatica]PHI30085.1 ABC transporter ATP-binding protein [Budvicia aquatica]
MSVLLSINNVCKQFGQFRALHNINLDIRQGEFIVLLGPSGCGKTTLLRLIAGFLQPDTGNILIEGQDISHLPPYRRPLNTVFQNYALFPHMSVLDNVAYGPRRNGFNRTDAHEQARQVLDLVGLKEFESRFPHDISGGQQQRVALARAIVNRPKLLLLDEPLSALDMRLRKRMQLELKHLQEKLGIAFVFVTHDQEEAMTLADRIVVMNAGRIEQEGSSNDIYRTPSSSFVAEFIGETNQIGYQVTGMNEIRLTINEQPIFWESHRISQQGVAILRPEHLQLVNKNNPIPAGHCQLHGTVSDIIALGSHSLVHLLVGEHVIVFRSTGFEGTELATGSLVCLSFNPTHLHLLGEAA